MKKLFFLLALFIAAGFTACEDPNKPGVERNYTITFNANGGSGGPAAVTVKIGETLPTLTLSSKPQNGTDFFTGYYDAQTGGTRYYDSNLAPAVEMWNITENTTLYAQWEPGYTVTFNANSGAGGPAPVIVAQGQALPALDPADKPSKATNFFTGYYDAQTGGTRYYDSNLAPAVELWDKTANTTLYAQWSLNPFTTISFNANEGTGTMSTLSITENTSAALTANSFIRTGYTFGGWAATSGGAVTYIDGQSYTAASGTNTVTLYAVWTAKTYTVSFDNTGGSGGQTGTVTATFGQPMPEIASVPTPAAAEDTFDGYWDAQTGGTRYYNADKSSAADWDKDATGTTMLYARFVQPTEPSVVSLVQSTTVAQASDFTYEEILALTREAIRLAGGLDGIVKAGDVVVLKPNVIVTAWNWGTAGPNSHIPELVNGICTDRRVVRAVAQIVREIVGPYDSNTGKGKIMVIEGSGSGNTVNNYTYIGYTLANLPEVNELIGLENEGTWSSAGNVSAASMAYVTQVTLDNYVYQGASGSYLSYYQNDGKYWVNKKMLEADALICLPVVKNHWNAGVTGGIKNISIGAAPPRIYGQNANNVGRNNMVNHKSPLLHDWIADYFSCLPADFVVMDGLQGLQNGPEPGVFNDAGLAQHQKNLRCILASKDALAIDTVEANIVGWDYASIPYMTKLTARGQVGPKPNNRVIPLRGDPKDIVVLGNKKVDDVRGTYAGNMEAGSVGSQISAANKAEPTVSINSAAFSGSNLNLALTLSSGANNNVVKIDVYIDGEYKESFNSGMNSVSVDASSLAAGSHNIEVRAYTRYMYCETATTMVTK
jgi:uncharacterized repeat protein (TIGR02543 family)